MANLADHHWALNGHLLDSAEGVVEPVKTMGPSIRFKGEVVIEYQKQVLEEARKYRTGFLCGQMDLS